MHDHHHHHDHCCREATTFLAEVQANPAQHAAVTMKQFLDDRKYSIPFRDWYLIPQVAAVWSASTDDVLAFPAATFIQFCVNHSLVQVLGRPIWRTVSRRSREYVRRVAASLPPARSEIKLSTPVASVSRRVDAACGRARVVVTDKRGNKAEYDHVIFGCHPDQALALLHAGGGVTKEERAALGGFKYQPNTAYLHTDDALMPARRQTWAAWNYMGKGRAGLAADASEPCCVSYWLNTLQNLPASMPQLFVTLNPSKDKLPAKDKILQEFSYSHPQYSIAAIEAQKAIDLIQGNNNTWFCGAYLGYGFHEDGVTSGLRAAAKLTGINPPWWGKTLYSIRGNHASTATAAVIENAADTNITVAVPSAAALYAEVQAKKASGGPYWHDNLGNGGPVGTATRHIVEMMAEVKVAQASSLAAQRTGSSAAASGAAAARRRGAAGATSASAAAGSGASVATTDLTGTTSAGDIDGYLLQSPDDVLHTYRQHIGAAPTTTSSSAASSVSPSTRSPSDRSGSDHDSGSEPGGQDSGRGSPVAGASSADSVSDNERDGSASSVAGSIYTPGNPGAVQSSTPISSPVSSARAASNKRRNGAAEIKSAFASSSSAVVTKTAARGGVSVQVNGVSQAVLRALQGRRAFKSAAVADALAAALNAAVNGHAFTQSASTATLRSAGATVGQLMARPGLTGGYTGQERPLQAPEQYSGAITWLWESLKLTALHTMCGPVLSFLKSSIQTGCIMLRAPDGTESIFGNPSAGYPLRARIRVHSWNFFARVAAEADLGLARSFIAGEWSTDDLTALFNIFIANRDADALSTSSLWTAWAGATINYLSFAIQMDNSIAGSRKNIHAHYDLSNDLFCSFLDARTMMYSCGFFETERRVVKEVDLVSSPSPTSSGISRPTVSTSPSSSSCQAAQRATAAQAEQVALSSLPVPTKPLSDACIANNASIVAAGKSVEKSIRKPYVAVPASTPADASAPAGARVELVFKSSLEEAQLRKLDHLIARANVQKTDRVLDLGFGWGGLSIRLAETVGCRVHGITLSKEQHDLSLERVKARGLDHLITFEIIDYRVFAAQHPGEFDKIISVEMIEAVGHNYFGEYMSALDRLLAPDGVVVIQAITMPEGRYKEYIRTTDFINTIIFPGGCCPSIAGEYDGRTRRGMGPSACRSL